MITPKRSDAKINFDQYKQQVIDLHRINNINFDPTIFNVI